jgi:DNA-binding CsgD family transcriptional regulator/tetratricopeptide (TPR) repeat protein
MRGALTFVGRDDELAALEAELVVARTGEPRVLLLEGPAGIGKTTLVERFLAQAGSAALRATADEDETEVSLGIIDQLLRQTGAELGGDDHVTAGAQLLDAFAEREIVVVDDAQWADAASLRALRFAFRRLADDPLLLVLVVRKGEAAGLPDGLRKPARHVLVHGLEVADVQRLADRAGVPISARAARRLRDHSGGSPLHAHALLAEVPPAMWEDLEATLPAPRSYAELVLARVHALDAPSARLLEAAAVLGLRVRLSRAARIGEVAEPFEAVDAPVAERLVELLDGPEIRFTHPLIRAAIYQGLGPARRARLHAAAAADAGDEVTALRHRTAASAGDDETLATELEAFAARRAAGQEWARATWALEAAARLSIGRDTREARMLGALEAAMYGGDGPRARALAAQTDGFAETPRLDSALAYVALGAGRGDEADRRLRRAWAACSPESDRRAAARIAERMAFLGVLRLHAGAAIEWACKALELLDEDDPARRPSMSWLTFGLYWSGERARARAVGAQPGNLFVADDDPAAARPLLAEAVARAGSLVVAARALATASRAASATGEWDDATVLAARSLVMAEESDEVAALAPAYWAAVSLGAARGDFEACERLEAPAAVFAAHMIEVQIARAELAAARGRHEHVLEALAPLVDMPVRDGVDDPGSWPWAHLHADALLSLGRVDEAERALIAYEQIAEQRGARAMQARLARVRGALHLAREEHDLAAAAFATALDVLPPGLPYERALIEFVHGRFLRRIGQRRQAAATLTAASETLAALGAQPALARCLRELDACGLAPVKRGAGVDRARLTAQERTVARLAATGLGNSAIATELLVSVKTVERHLTHVYRKLGIGSRAELTRMRTLQDP